MTLLKHFCSKRELKNILLAKCGIYAFNYAVFFPHTPVVKKLSLHATDSIIKLTRKMYAQYIKTSFSKVFEFSGGLKVVAKSTTQ